MLAAVVMSARSAVRSADCRGFDGTVLLVPPHVMLILSVLAVVDVICVARTLQLDSSCGAMLYDPLQARPHHLLHPAGSGGTASVSTLLQG